MSIIENLANIAREALANEIMKHSPVKNLNAQNVTDWINTAGNVGNFNVDDASSVVNAWEHAYISGLIYDKSNSTTIAYIAGYAKEIGLGAITNTADAYKDLYNNKTGIDIAKNSGENFSSDLYGSIFEPDSESKGRIKIKDNPGPILDLNNDDRMKGADLDSKMQKMLASLSQVPDLLGRIAENFKDSKISGIYAIDPLLVDLDGNGIETTPLTDGMMMDHDKDGFKELSAWVGGNDGILAYDKNNNGVIDNGNELFGDNYEKSDGTIATSGFDALSDLDTNNDGVINSSDESFSDLQVIKADGSIISIEEAGIASINLSHQTRADFDESGNQLLGLGSYTTTDGQTRDIGDYSLQVNKTISIAAEEVEVSAEIEALPYVPGYGVVHNLHQAMALDETGELQELVESFVAETNVGEKKSILTQIIYKWTGADEVVDGSRGENFDAKKLHVLEQFLNDQFIGKEGTPNPNPQAANLLLSTYTDLSQLIYAQLEVQTGLKSVYDMIQFETDPDTGKLLYDLSAVQEHIAGVISTDELAGQMLLTDFCQTFITLGYKDESNYSEFYDHFASYGQDYVMLLDSADKIVRYGTQGDDNIEGTAEQEAVFGQAGNDTIYTRQGDDLVYGGDGDDYIDTCENNDKIYGENGNDTIITGDGNDTVYGGDGNDYIQNNNGGQDILYGEAGNDTLIGHWAGGETFIGGTGNDDITASSASDTFIFNLGDGNDTIFDSLGTDTIKFGEGITAENTIFSTEGHDMKITFKNSEDSILIKNAAVEPANRIESYEFADGTVYSLEDVLIKLTTYGTSGDDTISLSFLNNKIYGYEGNDSIMTGNGNDTVYGGEGNDFISNNDGGQDVLYGEAGNDTLIGHWAGGDTFIGGTGNDDITASSASDTFIFNLGDGNDTIFDSLGTDTIKFGEGITAENTIFSTEGHDMKITFKNSEDSILIKNAAVEPANRIESYEFADGTVYSLDDVLIKLTTYGTSGDDTISLSFLNNKIYGYEGNDSIMTGNGNDTVYGGEGNDYISNSNGGQDVLYGEAGNDTLIGHWAGDTFIGGTGNDDITASSASDTFIFNLGDGNDTIFDSLGTDTIKFGDGITAENTVFTGLEKDNAMIITFTNSNDSILIKNATAATENRIEYYEFSNGTVLTIDDVLGKVTTHGTSENDVLIDSLLAEKLYGYAGNDSITVRDNDTVYGGDGNDSLISHGSNNVLVGEQGNDYLEGAVWNDTYIFNLGDGNDTILDNNGTDTIKFGEGITAENTIFSTEGTHIKITFKNSDDSILLSDAANSADRRIETFEFSDGTILTKEDMLQNLTNYGTSANDSMTGSIISEKIYGNDGNDSIYTNAGNDTVYGGSGDDYIENGNDNDVLYGEAGNDTIINNGPNSTMIGGLGNDYIQSAVWSDTYIFNLGDGNDTIIDNNGTDTLKFGEGITAENTIFSTEGTHIKITFKNSDDSILLSDAANSADRRIETFEFSDGTVLTKEEMLQNLTNHGTSANDTMTGSIISEKIYGYDGDDSINSAQGNDTVYGGAGNDYIENGNDNDVLYGEAGNDTIINNGINSTMIGGTGNDSMRGNSWDDMFIFNLGDGSDTIDAKSGNDTIAFASSVEKDDIAIFVDNQNNLFIDYGVEPGTDKINAVGNSVENVSVGDYTLTSNAINQLIQDMSAYATEQGIAISTVEDVKNNADLMNMVNSAWTEAA